MRTLTHTHTHTHTHTLHKSTLSCGDIFQFGTRQTFGGGRGGGGAYRVQNGMSDFIYVMSQYERHPKRTLLEVKDTWLNHRCVNIDCRFDIEQAARVTSSSAQEKRKCWWNSATTAPLHLFLLKRGCLEHRRHLYMLRDSFFLEYISGNKIFF